MGGDLLSEALLFAPDRATLMALLAAMPVGSTPGGQGRLADRCQGHGQEVRHDRRVVNGPDDRGRHPRA